MQDHESSVRLDVGGWISGPMMTAEEMEAAERETVNGWRYDPSEQAWTARVGQTRWLIIHGELADAPSITPEQVLEHSLDIFAPNKIETRHQP